MKCPTCGQNLIDNKEYCTNCGTKLIKKQPFSISVKGLLLIFAVFIVAGAVIVLSIMYVGSDDEVNNYIINHSNATLK
jgi:uncharacterized paraquat-inducible protein A